MEYELKDESIVAIIGGGPAGVSCSIRLITQARKVAKRVRVILLEGKDFERHYNQCVGVLSPPFEEILEERLNVVLPSQLIKREISAYNLHANNNEILLYSSKKLAPTYVVRRVMFDRFLLDYAQKLGVEIINSRATGIEFFKDEIRVYHESGYIKAHIVVGAFGMDEGMLSTFEEGTSGRYKRPSKFLKSFITKIHVDKDFIDNRLGNIIYAYIFPNSIPNIEFGAITPKEDHIDINIAGEKVTSKDMDLFIDLPEVKDHIPKIKKEELSYFEGKFPIARAKNPFGDRYVIVGDATGWLRPFKGKGINTAIITGISAADIIIRYGFSEKSLKKYADICEEFIKDYHFGNFIRHTTHLLARCNLFYYIIELAKSDKIIYDALFNSVSAHESFKNILKDILSIDIIKNLIRIKKYKR